MQSDIVLAAFRDNKNFGGSSWALLQDILGGMRPVPVTMKRTCSKLSGMIHLVQLPPGQKVPHLQHTQGLAAYLLGPCICSSICPLLKPSLAQQVPLEAEFTDVKGSARNAQRQIIEVCAIGFSYVSCIAMSPVPPFSHVIIPRRDWHTDLSAIGPGNITFCLNQISTPYGEQPFR